MDCSDARHRARARAGRFAMRGGNTYRVTAKAAKDAGGGGHRHFAHAGKRRPGHGCGSGCGGDTAEENSRPDATDDRLGQLVGGEQAMGQQEEWVIDGHPDQR